MKRYFDTSHMCVDEVEHEPLKLFAWQTAASGKRKSHKFLSPDREQQLLLQQLVSFRRLPSFLSLSWSIRSSSSLLKNQLELCGFKEP